MNNGITFLANPNFLNKSKRVTSLANGETISQSDYLNESQYYSAVQLFNKNINTFWHCNKKDGTYLSSNMEMKSFSQDPYKAINSYTSVYQGGSNMSDDSYFTTVVAEGPLSGSWAQITYPQVTVPTTQGFKIPNNFIRTIEQQSQIPKKVSLVASMDGVDVPDSMKRFDLLITKDFGTEFSTTIEIDYSGVNGGEFFSIFVNKDDNNNINSFEGNYTCLKEVIEKEIIHVGGLRTLKIVYNNERRFSMKDKKGIKFSKFLINGQNVKDFIHHSADLRLNPIDGHIIHAGEYTMTSKLHVGDSTAEVMSYSGDKHPWAGTQVLNFNEFKNVNKPYKTLRLIIQELYGGTTFKLGMWQSTGINVMENFTNNISLQKNTLENKFSGIPTITGVKLVEGFTSETPSLMEREKNIVNLINEFNSKYAKYVNCNGTHLNDNERPNCNPDTDYYRVIKRINIQFHVSNTPTSGTNKAQSLQFYTTSNIGVEEPVGIAYSLEGEQFSPNTSYSITIQNDDLGGLENFSGRLTHLGISILNSKLECSMFKVTVTDNRGVQYEFINKKVDDFDSNNSTAISLPEFVGSNSSLIKVYANDQDQINLYTSGKDELVNIKGQLENEIDDLIQAGGSWTKKKTVQDYNTHHSSLITNIKALKDLRYELDYKLREVYMIEGSTAANKKLEYDGTMFAGMLWTVLASSIIYYTLVEMN